MQILFLIFLTLISFTSVGCDQLYSLLDKEGAQEKELIGEAYAFESNPRVEEIQTLLKLYGYDTGKVDGVLGGRTRQKIEQFQNDAGLKVTRFVDQPTWEALNYFREKQLVIDDKLNVELIQTVLQKAGYKVGSVDGRWGPKTIDAIKSFQKKHKLNPDGKVGYKTLSRLSAYLPS